MGKTQKKKKSKIQKFNKLQEICERESISIFHPSSSFFLDNSVSSSDIDETALNLTSPYPRVHIPLSFKIIHGQKKTQNPALLFFLLK